MRRHILLILLVLNSFAVPLPAHGAEQFKFPLKPNSVRFAVIGDMGTGERPQYELARKMAEVRHDFPFDFVIMLGDNIYGGQKPKDFEKKFAVPYRSLLTGGVNFYASLGNHDGPNERYYKLFNMHGAAYYSFKKGNVRFFALDSNYMDPAQLAWLEGQLRDGGDSDWKICYFHHPLYSSGRAHGAATDLRQLLEPLFMQYGVDVVFAGHDHVYERMKPQHGIYYFTEGASGKLRYGNLRHTDISDRGFDTDRTFMLVEIAGDEMYFETIAGSGEPVDSGEIKEPHKNHTLERIAGSVRNPG